MKNAIHQDGIATARLSESDYVANFSDIKVPLNPHKAALESSRCYFCDDAPCVNACPTAIDIPGFIRKISTGNLKGAARDILEANILGASCARVCPTEVLCEDRCVRNTAEYQPVQIGALQRHATDWLLGADIQLFTRGASTGKRVAVVGAGPSGLSCAHHLARLGHAVTIFESRTKIGGLNEYGIAAYKMTGNIAQREIDYLLAIGGIDVRCNVALGRDIELHTLRHDFDAVFLAIGLGAVNALGLADEHLEGVIDAVDYIARLRQSDNMSTLPVGRRVVVIGGGMTAIDIATQIRRLGAEEVSIVYRRGRAQMSASQDEQQWAQHNGVTLRFWAQPLRLLMQGGKLCGIELERTIQEDDGRLVRTGESYVLPADMVFKAIGQNLHAGGLEQDAGSLFNQHGRVFADEECKTPLPGVWAGGDCVAGGLDLTVAAVQDGKIAAGSIDRFLQSEI